MISSQPRRRPSPAGRRRAFNRPAPNNQRKKGAKEYIHPSRFIKAARPVTAEAYQATHTFSDFAISPILQRNITAKGYRTPSPIQDQSIPVSLTGKDIVGIANTGTGKTAAFAIPMLHRLITQPNARALIMAPTRELAQQIEEECRALSAGSGIHSALLIGGVAINPQLRRLERKPRLIIGTPGRIKDHLDRGSLQVSNVNLVVLDEVDRMLDMGFVHDMRLILAKLAPARQSFFFSATLDDRIAELIKTFLSDPTTISVKTAETSDNVDQNVVRYESKDQKLDMLHNLLTSQPASKTLIFDETKRSVERLHKALQNRGLATEAIHGGKSQSQRQRALNRFKSNEVSILVATDVAARGIDVSDITHVINYSTPQSYSDYVHRIGRAGRAGRAGQALTFVEQDQPRQRY